MPPHALPHLAHRAAGRALAALLVVAFAVQGCGLGSGTPAQGVRGASAGPSGGAPGNAGTSSAPGGGTLTGAWVGPCCSGVDDADPLVAGPDSAFLDKIYEHLVTYSIDPATHGYGSIVPELAASWSSSADGTTWTFHLRQGIHWQDGSRFTSADVAFSIALCLDRTAGGCAAAGSLADIVGAASVAAGATRVDGVTTPDPDTVTVATTAPDFALPDTLTRVWILQEHSVANIPRVELAGSVYWTTPGKAVGTGPFRLAAYSRGKSMALEANPSYWRGRPKLARLVRLEFSDPAAARRAFDAGQLDFTYLTPDEVEAERSHPNATVFSAPSGTTDTLVFNPTRKPFDDQKIRLAFGEAIDRATDAGAIYGGGATPVPCFLGGAAYGGIETGAGPDTTRARQLFQAGLQEEGFASAASFPPLTLDAGETDPFTNQVLQALAERWRSVLGVVVKIESLPPRAWLARFDAGQSQISFVPIADGPDPNVAATYFSSSSAWPQGENGHAGYALSDPDVDRLLTSARSEAATSARAVTYADACRAVASSGVWASLWEAPASWAVSAKAGDVILGPTAPGASYDDEAENWVSAK